MRILICSDRFPSLGGIAKHMGDIAKELKSRGHSVTILTRKEKGPKVIEGIKIERVAWSNLNSYMCKNGNNFDMVIVGWYIYLNSALDFFNEVIYILPSSRKRTLGVLKKYGTVIEKISDRIALEKRGLVRCKKIIYPSNNIQKQILEDYKIKKGKVIHHGIDLKPFGKGNQSKKNYALTVANFSPQKGIDKLIHVARASQNKFIVLGDGEKRGDYEKLIKKYSLGKRIFLEGQKKPLKYYAQSKIYVLPSRYEAFGLVLLEAMASGLPCIAFKPDGKKIITASDEIIKDKKTGFLVKDEKEMAEKIDLLLSDEKLRKKMGKAARKEAEKYSIKKEVEKILDYK